MNVIVNTQPNGVMPDVNPTSKSGPVLEKAMPEETKTEVNKEKKIDGKNLSVKEVEGMIDALGELSDTIQTRLSFSVHQSTHEVIIRVVDKDTNEVIRQLPPDDLIELHEKMKNLTGFLLNENV